MADEAKVGRVCQWAECGRVIDPSKILGTKYCDKVCQTRANRRRVAEGTGPRRRDRVRVWAG
jgi:hypothetical protein